MSTVGHWNEHFRNVSLQAQRPVEVLAEFEFALPESGTALDYACGAGRNALFLAAKNLHVSAWDFSTEALNRLNHTAKQKNFSIKTRCIDLETDAFVFDEYFDVIVVSHYLYRPKFVEIINGLNPGGLLFYQTFTENKVFSQGPNNPDYLLTTNELLRLSDALQVVAYREDATVGDLAQGLSNQAYLVARKPK